MKKFVLISLPKKSDDQKLLRDAFCNALSPLSRDRDFCRIFRPDNSGNFDFTTQYDSITAVVVALEGDEGLVDKTITELAETYRDCGNKTPLGINRFAEAMHVYRDSLPASLGFPKRSGPL